MVVENRVLKYLEGQFEYAVAGVKKGAKHVGHMITSMDGLYYIAELVSSIFDAAEKFRLNAPTCIRSTITVFRGYMDLTCSVEWINRFNDWTSPDRKGRYIWERSIASLGYYISLTISDFTNLAYLLEQFKFINLGAWATPVNTIYTFSTITTSFFDISESKRIIDKTEGKSVGTDRRRREWERLSHPTTTRDEIIEVIDQKKRKWSLNPGSSDRIKEKKSLWYSMQYCKDRRSLRTFCRQKATKWQVIQRNNENKVFRHWCSIACNISYIVLLALGFIIPLVNIHWLLITSVFVTIVVNAIYVADFFIEEEFKKVRPPEAKLQGTFSV